MCPGTHSFLLSSEQSGRKGSPTENAPISYKNTEVWQTLLPTDQDYYTFQALKNEEGCKDISIWKMENGLVDYLVPKKSMERIKKALVRNSLDYVVIIPDVQEKIDATKGPPAKWTSLALRKGHRLDFKSYPSLEVINEYIEHVRRKYISIATVRTIGHSVENRTIQMIRISNRNSTNKSIILVGGQHAREWIAITSVLYIANTILTKFNELPSHMANKNWYVIPVLNPDGYEYTHTTDRLWRKNRRVNTFTKCRGVDTNRNFAKSWRILNVTVSDPCDLSYAGTSAQSEPETRALVGLLNSMKNKPDAFIDFHSYSQMILYPWSATKVQSPNRNQLRKTAQGMKMAIYKKSKLTFNYGTASELLYAASGAAIDYFHSRDVVYSYVIEGRDLGHHGFLVPPEQIIDEGKSLYEAVTFLASKLKDNKRNAKGKWLRRNLEYLSSII